MEFYLMLMIGVSLCTPIWTISDEKFCRIFPQTLRSPSSILTKHVFRSLDIFGFRGSRPDETHEKTPEEQLAEDQAIIDGALKKIANHTIQKLNTMFAPYIQQSTKVGSLWTDKLNQCHLATEKEIKNNTVCYDQFFEELYGMVWIDEWDGVAIGKFCMERVAHQNIIAGRAMKVVYRIAFRIPGISRPSCRIPDFELTAETEPVTESNIEERISSRIESVEEQIDWAYKKISHEISGIYDQKVSQKALEELNTAYSSYLAGIAEVKMIRTESLGPQPSLQTIYTHRAVHAEAHGSLAYAKFLAIIFQLLSESNWYWVSDFFQFN